MSLVDKDFKQSRVLMPRELNAENGAKALFIGEFEELIEVSCINCDEDGYHFPEEICSDCGGTGTITRSVQVSWATIKEIYKKVVNKYGVEP